MSLADDIRKLNELQQSGALSEQEFQQAKESLLAQNRPTGTSPVLDTTTWGVLIHLSQFLTYLIPLAGIIAPIILWQIKKDESEIIDRHGKIVANWLITEFILLLAAIPLCFVLVGIPLLFIVSVAAIVFPIIGAVKAGDGKLWPYPCSIRFFK
jgi:uncharacterized Tic20 family protein